MAARYLIDSDICIYLTRGKRRNESLTNLMRDIEPEGLAISVITHGEVVDGVYGTAQPALNMQLWRDFLRPFDILNVTAPIAEIWAEVRRKLRSEGRTVPDNDLIIASTALLFGMTVVTRNRDHFSRVGGLDVLVPELE